MDESQEKLIERVRADGVEFIYLQFTDVIGTMKSVAIPAAGLLESLEDGVWFDGSAIEGIARVVESDLYLLPDPASYALLPWESGPTARLICDLCLPDGKPFPADPRNALKAVLREADDLGFDYRVASELEFFVFDDREDSTARSLRLEPVDMSGYFDVPDERAIRLCAVTAQALAGFGFGVEATHHEVTPGQQEMDIAELGALEASDAIVMLKCALRAYGRRDGLLVSFMPKPIEGVSGSGMHLAQRLVNVKEKSNAFHDPASPFQLSSVGRQFIAGQLAHARGMCAVIAPLVNSYKRLLGGAEAPARVSWGRVSRGATIRVPEVKMKHGTLVELRAPDPSCNPYLALAAMLNAGLDGIKKGMDLREPIEPSGHSAERGDREEAMASPLPETLEEALEELDWDPVVREALGQPIYERFLAAKAHEWLAYRRHISSWELEHYLRKA